MIKRWTVLDKIHGMFIMMNQEYCCEILHLQYRLGYNVYCLRICPIQTEVPNTRNGDGVVVVGVPNSHTRFTFNSLWGPTWVGCSPSREVKSVREDD